MKVVLPLTLEIGFLFLSKAANTLVAPLGGEVLFDPVSDLLPEGFFIGCEAQIHGSQAIKTGKLEGMASEVLCGRCGALLTNPTAPCPRCGAPASGAYQAVPSAQRSHKSPALAAALAIVPGLGHFYLGHNVKGVAYLVGIGGLQFFGADLDLTVIGAAVGVPMELGGGGLWLFSIVDAYRTAKKMEAGNL